jgi:hypothetical protein
MNLFETRQSTKKLGNFIFSSRFDGGNACEFKCQNSTTFEVFPASDNHGHVSGITYRYWWMFSVRGFQSIDDSITISIKNATSQSRLYTWGLKPVFRIGHYGSWERIPVPITLIQGETTISIKFTISAALIVNVLANRLRWADTLSLLYLPMDPFKFVSAGDRIALNRVFDNVNQPGVSDLMPSFRSSYLNNLKLLAIFPWLRVTSSENYHFIIEVFIILFVVFKEPPSILGSSI